MAQSKETLISRKMLAWFDANRRELPWRRTRDPYHVWVSEIMLQQTTVAMAGPFYERFMARFPDVTSLATGELDEVLRLWSGLGYYARARNMHLAAKTIVTELGGKFPQTAQDLLELPGIGAYTSGAIASICFDERVAAMDCNVERVLARLFGIETDVRAPHTKTQLNNFAFALLPRKRRGDFNQSLIELGATVCLPGAAAKCAACPIRGGCIALASGKVAELPVKPKKMKAKEETHVVAAIEHRGRFLFRRRPVKGLWGGLWEMPSAVKNGEPTATLVRKLVDEHVRNRCEVERRPFCTFQHQLTHRTIQFEAFKCRIVGSSSQKNIRWLKLTEAHAIGLSTAMRHVIGSLEADINRA